jgi:hypothetical protein
VQVGGSVITGTVFAGGYNRLRDVWLDPAPVFEEVQVERFVGREWLLGPVHRFLDKQDRGYVVIHGEAGLGKTMFAAWLAYHEDWVCHFTRRRNGRLASTAMRNLAAQLIARYELGERFAPGGVLPEAAGSPGWFEQVLAAAAASARAAGGRVVVVVDGLDEAERVDGDLPLGLPGVLPRGVFFVVTCRTGTGLPALRRPWSEHTIRARDRANLTDLRQFVEAVADGDPAIRDLLTAAGLGREELVTRLLDRCGGVWVYLRYVLDELRGGLRTLADLDALPGDLAGYYTESLLPPDPDAGWAALRLPVLATPAAAAEPLPVGTLARFASVTDEAAVRALCRRRLRPFLATSTGPDGSLRYAIYHISLRDFLAGAGVGPGDLGGGQAAELADATRRAHGRIAGLHLAAFGGLPDLPLLAADPAVAGRDDGYALRYLAHHLERAGREADLHTLLAAETPGLDDASRSRNQAHHLERAGRAPHPPPALAAGAPDSGRNIWYAAHEAAGTAGDYLNDVHRARRLVAARVDDDLTAGRAATGLGLELHYTVMAAAVTTLAASVPPALVARLVQAGRWDLQRGLDHARRLPDPFDRAGALIYLARCLADRPDATGSTGAPIDRSSHSDRLTGWPGAVDLTEEIRAAVSAVAHPGRRSSLLTLAMELVPDLRAAMAADAIAAAGAIEDEDDRAAALGWLARLLPDTAIPDALGVALDIEDPDERAAALVDLIHRLPLEVLPQFIDSSDQFEGYSRAVVLAELGRRLTGSDLDAAIAAARELPAPDDRAWTLAVLAGRLDHGRDDLAREAAAAARSAAEPHHRAWALAAVARRLSGDERDQTATDAVRAARAAVGPDKPWALRIAAHALPDDDRSQVLREAFAAAVELDPEEQRARSLAQLVPFLVNIAADVLAAAATIEAEVDRAPVLEALAKHVPEADLKPILEAADALRSQPARALVLTALCWRLPDDLTDDLLTSVTRIRDPEARSQAIGVMSEHLPDWLLGDALGAVQSLHAEHGRALLLQGVADLMPPAGRATLLHQALQTARRILPDFPRAQVLTDLAIRMEPSEPVLSEAAATAQVIGMPYRRAIAVNRLIPLLAGPRREECLTTALADVRDRPWQEYRAWLLAELSQHVPDEDRAALLAEVVTNARRIERPEFRVLALAGLAAHLPPAERTALLDDCRTLARSLGPKAKLSYRLVAHGAALLPESVLRQGLTMALEVLREGGDPAAPVAVGRIARLLPTALLNHILAAVQGFPDRRAAAKALGAVALHLPDHIQEQALSDALAADDRLVARQAILTQATTLWPTRLTIPQLTLVRRCLHDTELDDCIGTIAAAIHLIHRTAGPNVLSEMLTTLEATRRWWPEPAHSDP